MSISKIIDDIRSMSLDELKNPNILTDAIYRHGLYPASTSPKMTNKSKPFCEKGLFTWQLPEQFADYLIFLSTRKITRYLESGVAAGGCAIWTMEYLRRFNNIKGWGFDPYVRKGKVYERSRVIREYTEINPDFQLIEDYSRNYKNYLSDKLDLVMIDSDHSFPSVNEDYENFKDTPLVALHDILECKGVMIKWQLLKQQKAVKFHEFCRLPDDFNKPIETWCLYGIGVVEYAKVKFD